MLSAPFKLTVASILLSFATSAQLNAQSPTYGVTKAYAGYTHSLFIRADGGLWATGDNQYRQLGDGTTTDRSTPIFVAGRIVAAAAGQTRTFYITDDGALYAVGRNLQGALGNGTATGNNANPQLVSNDVVSVSNKADHTVFIKSDGSLWAVGDNSNGQLGTGSTTDRYLPVRIAGDVIEARAGDGHTLFITADRKLWGMGANRYGQLGLGASQLDVLSPVVIATGVSTAAAGGWNQASEYHSIFAKTDGSVLAMGQNNNGQLGSGGKTDRLTPTVVSDRALQVDASQTVSLIVKNDGSLWGMGSNGFGQLGVQPNLDQTAPVRITPTDVVWASSGLDHTLFIKTGGALWGMGEDGSGRLGIPPITGRVESPLLLVSGSVPSPTAPTSVAASDGGSLSHVRVNWKPVLGATYYEVWRSTSTVFESGSLIGSRIEPGLFFDTTAAAGANYTYWVRAVNPGGTGSYSAADQGSVGAVPAIIQSPADRTINAGASTSFTVSATGNPVPSYQWQISTNGGSSWRNVVNDAIYGGATTNTLLLSATPASLSSARFRCLATNSFAASVASAAASLTVNSPPTISAQPLSASVSAGLAAIFSVTIMDSAPLTYQWRKNGVVIPGATSSTLSFGSAQPSDAATYSVVVSNSFGSTVSAGATLTVFAATPPIVSTPPQAQTVSAGGSVTFSVAASGTPSPTFQWRKDGVDLPGATGSTLTLTAVAASDHGSYTVVITNGSGSVTSAAAVLTVNPALPAGPTNAMTNLSVRTTMASGQVLIVGAVTQGGAKTILLRAAGPALNVFGLAGMVDPRLELYTTGVTPVAVNEDWPASLTNAFASLGAFAFANGSKDAAITQSLSGSFTVQARGTGPGALLVEAYDADGGVSPRLINLSARNRVGTGADVLIAGFTISGTGTKQVLIRAVGPALAAFGVPGTLVDPKLQVFNGANVLIATNDTWSPSLATTFTQLGAFALPANSKDAALLTTLDAGSSYTVQVSGADGGTGEALIEVYEVP